MKGYIYLIENKINGKKYVGKTYNTIEQRWRTHLKDCVRFVNRPLYQAIVKYGSNSFLVSELEFCENPEEREIYWIQYYNTYRDGYNATLGGDGKLYFSYSDEEVIEKYKELLSIIEVAKFFNCSTNTISVRLKNNNIEVAAGGSVYNSKRTWKTQKVNQYSLENEFLRSFDSYHQGALWLIENNYTKGQPKHIVANISKVCRGIENRKQTYGFIWKMQEDI